jgi:hypothetical protein
MEQNSSLDRPTSQMEQNSSLDRPTSQMDQNSSLDCSDSNQSNLMEDIMQASFSDDDDDDDYGKDPDFEIEKEMRLLKRNRIHSDDEKSSQFVYKKSKTDLTFSSEDSDGEHEDRLPLLTLTDVTSNLENEKIFTESDSDSCNSEIFPMLTCKTSRKDDMRGITRDKVHPKVYVSKVKKDTLTKTGRVKKSDRVYDSKHLCPFCWRWQTNFSHHVLSKQHCEEPEVKKILEFDANSKERKRLLTILRLKGEHKHNLQVVAKKDGELLIGRRIADDDFDMEAYTPCPNCLEWIRCSTIKRHQPFCPAKADFSVSKGSLIIQSKILTGKICDTASNALVNEVFPIMQEDKVGTVAKSDLLIVNLGNQWMQRNVGNKLMRKYYTSSIMRLAAKLRISAQQMLKDNSLDMDSLLQPKYFNTMVKAALQCCRPEDSDDEKLQAPSNAVKLGFDLKRMASAKLALALMEEDQDKKDQAKSFLTLMKINWGLQVTKLAKTVLQEKSFNKPVNLPLPEDVKKLAIFMENKLRSADLKDTTYQNFKDVAKLALARLTLYNRRRCHEVQALRYLFFILTNSNL